MRRWLAAAAALAVALPLAAEVAAPDVIGGKATRLFPATPPGGRVAAVLVSGDAGLDRGQGPRVAKALAARGIAVLGVSSPRVFGRRLPRAEVVAAVAAAVRRAMAETGARRIVLMGQSFGADIVATAAPDLPAGLRDHIAAILLVVPAPDVYFRADVLGFAYHGTPDAQPAEALRKLDWAPVICIHGLKERDSLCPLIDGPTAHIVALPGGHFLNHDDAALIGAALRELHGIDPAIVGEHEKAR